MEMLHPNIVKDILSACSTNSNLREFIHNKLGNIQAYKSLTEIYGISINELVNRDLIKAVENNIVDMLYNIDNEFSIEFVRYFQNRINFMHLSCNRYLSEDIVREFYKHLNIENICSKRKGYYYNLSPEFLGIIRTFG